jgi:poly-gamma-glutamate synthesis protein (capsule biosynthesis protein)
MKIAFLGDIALIGKYDLTQSLDSKQKLKPIADYLKKFDHVIGNLETPLTSKKTSLVCKSMHLRSDPINVEILKFLNIDIVSLANNHSYDFGRQGIDDTIDILKFNNIDFYGIDNKNIQIGNISLRGYCCLTTNPFGYNTKSKEKGVNILNFKKVISDVKTDNINGKISAISMHWGDEHTNYPRYEHIKFSRHLSKINNVVINGHHPHVIQGIEEINNSIIAYSQGNFCFDDCKSITGTGMELKQNDSNRESFILEVEFECNKIINTKTTGINEIDGIIKLKNLNQKLNRLNKELLNIDDIHIYQCMREAQFNDKTFRLEKFGSKDIMWYLKRINYYAIGAFLFAKFNQQKYSKMLKDWENE